MPAVQTAASPTSLYPDSPQRAVSPHHHGLSMVQEETTPRQAGVQSFRAESGSSQKVTRSKRLAVQHLEGECTKLPGCRMVDGSSAQIFEARIVELHKQVAMKQCRVHNLEATVAQLQKEKSLERDQVHDLQASVAKLQKENSSEQSRVQDLQTQIAELEDQFGMHSHILNLKAAGAIVAHLQEDVNSRQSKVQDLKSLLFTAWSHMKTLTADLAMIQARNAQLQVERDAMQGKVQDLQATLAKLEEEKLSQQFHILHLEASAFASQDKIMELEEVIGTKQSEVRLLQSTVVKLQEDKCWAQSDFKDLRAAAQDLQGKNAKLEAEKQSALSQIHELKGAIAIWQADVALHPKESDARELPSLQTTAVRVQEEDVCLSESSSQDLRIQDDQQEQRAVRGSDGLQSIRAFCKEAAGLMWHATTHTQQETDDQLTQIQNLQAAPANLKEEIYPQEMQSQGLQTQVAKAEKRTEAAPEHLQEVGVTSNRLQAKCAHQLEEGDKRQTRMNGLSAESAFLQRDTVTQCRVWNSEVVCLTLQAKVLEMRESIVTSEARVQSLLEEEAAAKQLRLPSLTLQEPEEEFSL